MARPSKPNHAITARLEQEIYDRLNQFCKDSGQAKTVAIERALDMYMNDYYEKQAQLDKLNNTK